MTPNSSASWLVLEELADHLRTLFPIISALPHSVEEAQLYLRDQGENGIYIPALRQIEEHGQDADTYPHEQLRELAIELYQIDYELDLYATALLTRGTFFLASRGVDAEWMPAMFEGFFPTFIAAIDAGSQRARRVLLWEIADALRSRSRAVLPQMYRRYLPDLPTEEQAVLEIAARIAEATETSELDTDAILAPDDAVSYPASRDYVGVLLRIRQWLELASGAPQTTDPDEEVFAALDDPDPRRRILGLQGATAGRAFATAGEDSFPAFRDAIPTLWRIFDRAAVDLDEDVQATGVIFARRIIFGADRFGDTATATQWREHIRDVFATATHPLLQRARILAVFELYEAGTGDRAQHRQILEEFVAAHLDSEDVTLRGTALLQRVQLGYLKIQAIGDDDDTLATMLDTFLGELIAAMPYDDYRQYDLPQRTFDWAVWRARYAQTTTPLPQTLYAAEVMLAFTPWKLSLVDKFRYADVIVDLTKRLATLPEGSELHHRTAHVIAGMTTALGLVIPECEQLIAALLNPQLPASARDEHNAWVSAVLMFSNKQYQRDAEFAAEAVSYLSRELWREDPDATISQGEIIIQGSYSDVIGDIPDQQIISRYYELGLTRLDDSESGEYAKNFRAMAARVAAKNKRGFRLFRR